MSDYWNKFERTRLTRRRFTAASGAGILGAAFIAACGSDNKAGGASDSAKKDASGLLVQAKDETSSLKRGGTLKDFVTGDRMTDDPMISRQGNLNKHYNQFFRQKGGYLSPGKGELVGDLAESWEMSPDKLQLTMKLSTKAHFHPVPPVNGRALAAQDVLASWERLKAVGNRRDELVNSINPNAPVVSLTSPDSRTIVIKFVEPISTILQLFANTSAINLYIVPAEAMDPKVLDLRRVICGTGPWYQPEYTPSARYVLKANPAFGQDDRNLPYIDTIEQPIIPEYATGLAQFRTGNLHRFTGMRAEDILSTKRDVPQLEMLSTDVVTQPTRFYFGYVPASPFRDERVRQAYSMAWDRDLFIDVFYNVPDFEKAGLPMTRRWSSTLQADAWEGWWLDPQGKEFGANAKYLQHDIAEAKKLLAAAGYASGVDATFRASSSNGWGIDNPGYRNVQILHGMSEDVGFHAKSINTYNTPEFDTVRAWGSAGGGRFEGLTVATSYTAGVEPANYFYRFFNSKGGNFYGFDAQGKGDSSGDPAMDDLTKKMRVEYDEKKRLALVQDLQRLEAQRRYYFPDPGGANGFTLAWPALRNRDVWRTDGQRDDATLWLDQTKAPFKT